LSALSSQISSPILMAGSSSVVQAAPMVTLYAKSTCPFCEDARETLRAEHVTFHEVEVGGSTPEHERAREQLAELFGIPIAELTVPKVAIGGFLIASSEELRDLRATSALRELARRAGAIDPSVSSVVVRQPMPEACDAVCILHTGPTTTVWLDELHQRLVSLGATVRFLDVERLGTFDPASPSLNFGVVVNRVSDAVPPPLARFLSSVLSIFQMRNVPLINGAQSCLATSSKVVQHALFESQGLRTPRSMTVRCAADVEAAIPLMGEGTVLFKPNAGSFGKGIVKFDDRNALLEHGKRPSSYGNDGIALVQRFLAVQKTYRVFLLRDRVQCAVAVSIDEGQTSGQCMASAQKRRRVDGASVVESMEVEDDVQAACVRVLQAAQADVASIEYLVDPESGDRLYYDFNLLSTYPDSKAVGRDCWLELAAYILERSKRP